MTPKAPVEPADLTKRVTLQSVTLAGDDEGGRGAEAWADVATVWAKVEDGPGTTPDVAGSPNARRTGTAWIRSRADVAPNGWRLVLNGRALNVAAVAADGGGRLLKVDWAERVGATVTPTPTPDPDPAADPSLDFSDAANSMYFPVLF
jgi:SPP1 family predicted phage head-tail adaptor